MTVVTMSNSYAANFIDRVTINGTEEPVEFVNSYNLERCLEFDRLRKRVENLDQRTCNGLRNYYARQAAQEEEAKLRNAPCAG